jgi:hypothetical protein
MKKLIVLSAILHGFILFSQNDSVKVNTISPVQKKDLPAGKADKNALRFNLNEDGSHYFQVTFLNQVWLWYNESNDSTTLFNRYAPTTFDIGLRRTRIQMFGQISDRTFIYFQFGQNNFNNTYNYSGTGNRKIAAFFHDALCEFKVSNKDQLKIGAGLTVMNGLSRFSQPSVGTIMTLDLPVFLQYSVDQIDIFDRRLAVYARGQLGKLDYRMYMANPFPVNSNGTVPAPIGRNAMFANTAAFAAGKGPGINYQYGTYLSFNLLDKEPHVTPYMSGTYLGRKKVWNIAVGGVYQQNATWFLKANESGAFSDTSFANMMHLSAETFLDIPLNADKQSALNAHLGYYFTDYGYHYLRYNGLMNPASGSTAGSMIQSNAYGNAFPMFGSGQQVYAQFGILLPKQLLGEKNGQLMPFASAQYADYDALQHKSMVVLDCGLNWLVKGHQSKISLDYQNRPTFYFDQNKDVKRGARKSCLILQYQITI